MAFSKLKDDVFAVGVVIWDKEYFDELIPLPEGTSYNSYLVIGSEKVALIDSVDPEKKELFYANLAKSDISKIDYIISNHAEQDHSGSIPALLDTYPQAKVVTNQKCKDFLKDLLEIDDAKFLTIGDKDTLSLGNKTLEFHLTPWVHWPETMVTYLKEDKILFSCDFFGSHYASSELFVSDEPKVFSGAKRYFSEIMMPFRPQVKKNVERVETLDLKMIAPSHGQVYKNPKAIIEAYKEWISDNVKKEVLIPYVSMHGSTLKMVNYLVDLLTEKGFIVKPFNLSTIDIGNYAISLIDASTIIVASPTVLAGPHPLAVYGTFLTNLLRPKTKFLTVVGSFGWGGKMIETLKDMVSNLKVELIEPVLIKGVPKKSDYQLLDKLVLDLDKKHQELGIR